jgi:magnesium-transporting ATPase (P-type)
MAKKDINEVTLLAASFIRWGLGLFVLGLIIGYPPLVHYLQKALQGPNWMTSANVTLWLGCPYAVQIGALGMVAIGAVFGLFPADELEAEARDYTALWLCVVSLLAVAIIGFVGYLVLNNLSWSLPGTFAARDKGWLYALAASTAAYVIGVALAYASIMQITYYKAER